MLAAAAALCLAVAAPQTPPPLPRTATPNDPVERRREAVARELVRIGGQIQREVERGDAAALLARVPEDGLRCGGRVVPKAKVARDLRSAESWLHGVFFGRPDDAARPGAPASLAALFRSARDVAIVVSFEPDARAGALGRPCIDFRVKGSATPGAPLCFEERAARWWFTESLYPCG